MSIEIVEGGDADVRNAVFRFRYDIYVREMSRTQKDADHAGERIEDSLDAFAKLLAARDTASRRIVGTVRGNVLGDGDIGYYAPLYGLDRLTSKERRATSITTRLMVERGRRGTTLALRLSSVLYHCGLRQHIEADYIDCNSHLVPFFEHLGYRSLRLIAHPDYGIVTLMRMDLEDGAHLRRIGSPLLRVWEMRADYASVSQQHR